MERTRSAASMARKTQSNNTGIKIHSKGNTYPGLRGARRLCPSFQPLDKKAVRFDETRQVKPVGVNKEQRIDFEDASVNACNKALEELELSGPIKTTKKTKIANPASLTPTVILNGLAMARGEQVEYKIVKKTPLPSLPVYDKDYNVDQFDWMRYYYYGFDPGENNPNNFSKPIKRWIYPYLFRVEVSVGDRTFTGEGKSQQAARHQAAQHALEVLQSMPVPKQVKKVSPGKKKELGESTESQTTSKVNPVKSPISVLYEKALACRLKVDFTVTSEEGPPHLKIFKMKATVLKPSADVVISVEGQGSNKNIAKTNAASNALDMLEGLSLPTYAKNTQTKKLKANDGKVAALLSSSPLLHPCSRLSQILQAKKEEVPVYTLISSDEKHHETKFVMQCCALGQTSTGEGRNKKEAKLVASENMLKKLGFFPQKLSKVVAETTAMENAQPTSSQKTLTARKVKRKNKSSGPGVLPTLVEV